MRDDATILMRSFVTDETSLNPYMNAMLGSYQHWTKRAEGREKKRVAYRRYWENDLFAVPHEDLPSSRVMLPKTVTKIDDDLTLHSCFFTGEKNEVADVQSVKDVGFLSRNAKVLIKKLRSRPSKSYSTCDFLRIYNPNIHQGNFFVSKVSNPSAMQIYPDRENDVIRVWSGSVAYQRLCEIFLLDNENRTTNLGIRSVLVSLLSRYYSRPEDLVVEYFDPFIKGIIPGQKIKKFNKTIENFAEMDMLDEVIGDQNRHKFQRYIANYYGGFRGQKEWNICVPDGIVVVKTNFGRTNFTKREKRFWNEVSDYTCQYCQSKWTRQSRQYKDLIEKYVACCMSVPGLRTKQEITKLATDFVEIQQRDKLVDVLPIDHAEVTALHGKDWGLAACTSCNSKKGKKSLSSFMSEVVSGDNTKRCIMSP